MVDKADPAGNGGDHDHESWADLIERSQRLTAQIRERQATEDGFSVPDPGIIGRLMAEVNSHLAADPARLQEAQARLQADYARLADMMSRRLKGEAVEPVAEPAPDDRRFKDPAWSENPVFDGIKQFYLLTSRWLVGLVDGLDNLNPKTRHKAAFYTRQFVNAMAPTNFWTTNPKVLRATVESGGENLRRGFHNFLDDLERGHGHLRISLTRPDAFRLGESLAITPGKVVFENDLMQLIQYAPTTPTVHRRPLLIVPPWINKFYVLDLQPRNSFIRWAVDQGHTVFVVSWVNPNKALAHKRFDDYMAEGPLTALDAIEKATSESSVNAIGYCIGGTLLACTLAHMAAVGDTRVASATFFTTLVDFAEPGELGVFIDEDEIALLETHMQERGFLEGAHMAQVFNMLRENDLIWSYVVNNYLMGHEPPPFDILYWNADSTRMPAMMHSVYLRQMYLENRLVRPGAAHLAGTDIDLRRITVPTYILATREDHIAPWRSTYAAVRHYGGRKTFVLAGSGHIAGVINPPVANKYGYWTAARHPKDPDAWLDGAHHHDGSWWPHWAGWSGKRGGGRVPARSPGDGALTPIEDAPGRYVKMKADG